MRCRMLRTVSAGPAMVLPGIVGLSTEAPMTPRRDAELVHGVRDDAGRIAERDQALDHALRRARYRHQLDVLGRDAAGQSFRLCNLHWSAPGCAALLYRATLTRPRAAHKAAPVGRAKSPAEPSNCWGAASNFAHGMRVGNRLRKQHATGVRAILPTRKESSGSRRKSCAAGGGHCRRAACPRLRRSLPLPPFRHSGLHSHGIRTARPLISSTRAHGEPDVHFAEGRTSKGQSP